MAQERKPYIPPHLRPKTVEIAPNAGSGYIRPALATGLRVVGPAVGALGGGLLGSAVPVLGTTTGAVAGGTVGGAAGEYLAQLLEGRDTTNLKRLGISAALGGFPGKWMVQAGKPLVSGLIGGGLGYAGTAGYKHAEGEPLRKAMNPLEWSGEERLAGPILGMGIGSVFGKFTKPKSVADTKKAADNVAKAVAKAKEEAELAIKWGPKRKPPVPTIDPITGKKSWPASVTEPVSAPKPVARINAPSKTISKAEEIRAGRDATRAATLGTGVEKPIAQVIDKAPSARTRLESLDKAIKAEKDAAAKIRAVAAKTTTETLTAEQGADAQFIAQQNKIAENATKLRAIEQAKIGRKATAPSISEGVAATTPEGGRASMSRRFVKPAPPKGMVVAGNDTLQDTLRLPGATALTPVEARAKSLADLETRIKTEGIAPAAPTQEMAPGLERDNIALHRYTNKVEAAAIAKATGGTVYQHGPRQYSIRFREEVVEPTVVTPSPTISFDVPDAPKRDMPRMTALEKGPEPPVSTGPRVIGFGNQWSVSGHPELGEFRDMGTATRALRSFEDDVPADLANAIDTLAAKEAGAFTPAEIPAVLQKMAAVTNTPAPPTGTLKFPTAKLPGVSQPPILEQPGLLDTPTIPETPGLRQPVEGGAIPVRIQSKADVLGEAYPKTQAAEKAGDIPKTDPFYAIDDRGRPVTPARMQGMALATTKPKKPVPPKADIVPGPAELTSDDLKKLSPDARMQVLTDLVNKFKNQKGEIDPAILIRLGLTSAGAATGAAMSPEDRLKGALLGGAAGLGAGVAAGKLPVLLGRAGGPSGRTVRDIAQPVTGRVANYIRGSLLSDPRGLFINSVLGPSGSNFWGGVEELTKGALTGDRARADTGRRAVASAMNIPGWLKTFSTKFGDALDTLHDVEGRAGEIERIGERTKWDKVVEFPATLMLTGDLTAAEKLTESGVPEHLMRVFTNTAEPQRELWRTIANFPRGEYSAMKRVLAPFVRTAANIMESGTERTPILGDIINIMGKSELRKPVGEQIIQEGIGVVVFGLGYAAGVMTDPDTNKVLKVRNAVSNLGGHYSLLSGAGFAAGQAVRAGRNPYTAVVTEFEQGMPLPSTDPIRNMATAVGKAVTGEYDTPMELIPRMAIPKLFLLMEETGIGIPGVGSPSLSETPETQVTPESEPRPSYIPPHLR